MKVQTLQEKTQTPTLPADQRYQSYAILLLAFLTQYFGKKIAPELMTPLISLIIVVIGAIGSPIYMMYGIMMSRLRNQYNEALKQGLVEAAQSPPTTQVVVNDPVVADKKYLIRLHEIEKPTANIDNS